MKKIFIALVFILGASNYLSAQVFDYIVAKDGTGNFATLQEAIDACPDDERKVIFIKSGTYEEKVMIGSHSKTSKKLISLIGEDSEKVVISWDDYNGKMITYDGREVKSGTPQSATFTINAPDFYAENITIQNSSPSTNGQAVALYNVGDRQTFNNCRLIGYQDTHYLKKGRRSYFYNCYIEGGTDYICAGGTSIFEQCQLHSVRNGSYITAPEDISAFTTVGDKKYYYGFVFRDCTLTTEPGFEVYLGRPWQGTSSSVFLSNKMEGIKPAGWSTWSGDNHTTSFFAEYNSMDLTGNLIDVSNRVDWSYQLTKDEVDTYYTNEKIYSFVSGEYNPFSLVIAPKKPLDLTVSANNLKWTAVSDAKGYIIYENGEIVGFSTSSDFAYTVSSDKTYTVKTVGQNGNLSEAGKVGDISGISDVELDEVNIFVEDGVLYLPENKKSDIYTISGALLKSTLSETEVNLGSYSQGIYLVKVTTTSGNVYGRKINLK